MTPEEFTDRLPRFTGDSGKTFGIKPPFEFNGLSARIFPLRASLDVLQQLCNSYVNVVPPEVGRFRAALPYVYLAVLDYGQISELVSPSGWFPQAEVYFGVPVEWYKVVGGRWVFHDWAVLTPYIFVNDDFSVPLGRTVYGFPKMLARLTAVASRWPIDPVSPITVARVETSVFPELYKGRRMESRVFLEVTRDAPSTTFRLPFDPHHPMAPWVVASNLAQAFAGLGRDAMWLAQSSRVSPVQGDDPGLVGAMLERLAPALAAGGEGFILNSLNLKQFPRSDQPEFICYQALTNGPLQTTGVNGGGLLGEERTLLGDLSGGYSIDLHQYSSLPIARILGLEVDRRWRGDGVDVASLTPVMPFWINVNVKYQRGINLGWQTRTGIWRGANGEPLDPSQAPARPSEAPLINTTTACAVDSIRGPFRFTDTTVRVLPLLADRRTLEQFIETRINAAISDSEAVGTRRRKSLVRLSLWARPAGTDRQEDEQGGGNTPKALPDAYVYMTATSLGHVTSGTNNVGDWAKYELSFLIPVKWERQDRNGGWRLEGVGLFPAYSFVDNAVAAISRSEVLGIPTSRARFVRPDSVWLQEGAANLGDKQTLLRMDAEVFPAIGLGQHPSIQRVVAITARDNDDGVGDPASPTTPDQWANILKAELEAKKTAKVEAKTECNTARALALELLGNATPISLFALKQFRDVVDPGKACYQSLVRVSRALEEVVDLREIEETLRVRIHDFPTLNPVESLGIFAKRLREAGSGIIYATQAIRPFYIRATLNELGERILSRAGTGEWKLREKAFVSLLSADGPAITLDKMAERMQDQGSPCLMSQVSRRSAQRRRRDAQVTREVQHLRKKRKALGKMPGDQKEYLQKEYRQMVARENALDAHLKSRVTKQEARDSLEKIDPQIVIESILSREWGNVDENARWRRGRQAVVRAREAGLAGGSIPVDRFSPLLKGGMSPVDLDEALEKARQQFADVEAALYGNVRQDKVNRPGRPPLDQEQDVELMIESMREFTLLRLRMEYQFNTLASWSISRSPAAKPSTGPDPWPETSVEISAETQKLVKVIREIAGRVIVGEPADENLDPHVPAGLERLQEILKVFEDAVPSHDEDLTADAFFTKYNETYFQAMARSLRGRVERRFEPSTPLPQEQAVDMSWQLVDQLREAVQLATRYCNAQRDALLNKLSRGYQKPDFCVRRDALGRARDSLLPRDQSWDEDWYYGSSQSGSGSGSGETRGA